MPSLKQKLKAKQFAGFERRTAKNLRYRRRLSIGWVDTEVKPMVALVLSRDLTQYNLFFNRDIKELVLSLLRAKQGRDSGVDILDIGLGSAKPMRQLREELTKERQSDKVRIFGLNIAAFPSEEQLKSGGVKYRRLDAQGQEVIEFISYANRFAHQQAGGIADLAREFRENAKALNKHWVGLAETHDFDDKMFDLIISNRTIEYCSYPFLALENIVNHLKPGGIALIEASGIFLHAKGGLNSFIIEARRAGLAVDVNNEPHTLTITKPRELQEHISFGSYKDPPFDIFHYWHRRRLR